MGQLHMLLLILTNGNQVRLIQQDIAGHEAGVCKQTCIDIIRILCRFILELGHTAKLTEHRVAIQHPAKLCMLVNMALNKQSVLFRIQTAGDILSQLLQRTATQVSRVLPNSNGMQVSHKVEAIIFLCALGPVLHSTKVRAERQIAGGFNARKHSLFLYRFFLNDITHCGSLSFSQIITYSTTDNSITQGHFMIG